MLCNNVVSPGAAGINHLQYSRLPVDHRITHVHFVLQVRTFSPDDPGGKFGQETDLDFGEPAIDVGLPEGGTAKPSACDIPTYRATAPQLNALKKSAMPAPVTPSITRCAVLSSMKSISAKPPILNWSLLFLLDSLVILLLCDDVFLQQQPERAMVLAPGETEPREEECGYQRRQYMAPCDSTPIHRRLH
jgi:hypothetical protein